MRVESNAVFHTNYLRVTVCSLDTLPKLGLQLMLGP